MSGAFLELGTPVEHCVFDLVAYGPASRLIGIFPGVSGDPVRSHGTWVIPFTSHVFGPAEAIVPADEVAYFLVVNVKERADDA